MQLVWKGNPKFENDAERSLPSLAALAPLAVMGAVSALLTLLSVCLCVYFYVCRELNTLWFILLLMALLAVFILDTLIAHRIYKSRAGKYGDVLTVFTVLSLGLLGRRANRHAGSVTLITKVNKGFTTESSDLLNN